MQQFHYVYILRSQTDPNRHYVGYTTNLHRRLTEHNSGNVGHTLKFKPWRIKTAIAFEDPIRAREFERFLKSGSGRTFARDRL